jgi:hypothetical protein
VAEVPISLTVNAAPIDEFEKSGSGVSASLKSFAADEASGR